MGFVSDIIGGITGSTQADATEDAARIQAAAGDRQLQELIRGKEEGLGFLQPFGVLGQQGLDNRGILTDSNAQFDFLQSNPLFKFALDNANRNTMQTAAAGGRLSAGDTLQQLTNNSFQSALPFLQNQQQNVFGLLNQGQNLSTAQANTSIGVGSQMGEAHTGIGNALAAGQIGEANAKSQGASNLLNIGLTAAGMFSDKRLKTDIKKTGKRNGFNWYSWKWNKLAERFGLSGDSSGVIAQEIIDTGHVYEVDGYLCVDYKGLGVM